jgi:hypothetical protein
LGIETSGFVPSMKNPRSVQESSNTQVILNYLGSRLARIYRHLTIAGADLEAWRKSGFVMGIRTIEINRK